MNCINEEHQHCADIPSVFRRFRGEYGDLRRELLCFVSCSEPPDSFASKDETYSSSSSLNSDATALADERIAAATTTDQGDGPEVLQSGSADNVDATSKVTGSGDEATSGDAPVDRVSNRVLETSETDGRQREEGLPVVASSSVDNGKELAAMDEDGDQLTVTGEFGRYENARDVLLRLLPIPIRCTATPVAYWS